MSFISETEKIRVLAKQHGKYRKVAQVSGVGYEWLTKFARGDIKNPRVDSIAKLQKFFNYPEEKPCNQEGE